MGDGPDRLDSTIDLLARARRGDQGALEHLFERHHRPLARWASGRLPRWARRLSDTDDLVQDVLLQTFRKIDTFDARGPGALQAYLRQGVMNRVRDELRAHGRRPPAVGLDADDESARANGPSPLEQAIGSENFDRYERALAQLTTDEREAILGRLEMGYTYQELAEAIGRPSAEAARKATERALVRLAEEMRRARS